MSLTITKYKKHFAKIKKKLSIFDQFQNEKLPNDSIFLDNIVQDKLPLP